MPGFAERGRSWLFALVAICGVADVSAGAIGVADALDALLLLRETNRSLLAAVAALGASWNEKRSPLLE